MAVYCTFSCDFVPVLPEKGKKADPVIWPAEDDLLVPHRMGYGDIHRAYDTIVKSSADDPVYRYLKETPDRRDRTKRWKVSRKFLTYTQLYKVVHDKAVWTIRHGDSIMFLGDPLRKQRPWDKMLNTFLASIGWAVDKLCLSHEQQKRVAEFTVKTRKAVEDALGRKTSQMIEVRSLATTPEYQGQGYATALVHLATNLAERRGVDSWLISSNTLNRGFYQSLGFQIVVTYYLGTNSATWTGPPVPVDVMVRTSAHEGHRMSEKHANPASMLPASSEVKLHRFISSHMHGIKCTSRTMQQSLRLKTC